MPKRDKGKKASKLALGSGHSNKPSNQQPSDNSDSMQVDPQRPRTVPKPPPSDPLALTPKDIAERRKEREERAKLSAIIQLKAPQTKRIQKKTLTKKQKIKKQKAVEKAMMFLDQLEEKKTKKMEKANRREKWKNIY